MNTIDPSQQNAPEVIAINEAISDLCERLLTTLAANVDGCFPRMGRDAVAYNGSFTYRVRFGCLWNGPGGCCVFGAGISEAEYLAFRATGVHPLPARDEWRLTDVGCNYGACPIYGRSAVITCVGRAARSSARTSSGPSSRQRSGSLIADSSRA